MKDAPPPIREVCQYIGVSRLSLSVSEELLYSAVVEVTSALYGPGGAMASQMRGSAGDDAGSFIDSYEQPSLYNGGRSRGPSEPEEYRPRGLSAPPEVDHGGWHPGAVEPTGTLPGYTHRGGTAPHLCGNYPGGVVPDAPQVQPQVQVQEVGLLRSLNQSLLKKHAPAPVPPAIAGQSLFVSSQAAMVPSPPPARSLAQEPSPTQVLHRVVVPIHPSTEQYPSAPGAVPLQLPLPMSAVSDIGGSSFHQSLGAGSFSMQSRMSIGGSTSPVLAQLPVHASDGTTYVTANEHLLQPTASLGLSLTPSVLGDSPNLARALAEAASTGCDLSARNGGSSSSGSGNSSMAQPETAPPEGVVAAFEELTDLLMH
jgi:hypothetical protein